MNPPVRVVVSRHFDAAAENVFDAWVDPAWIGSWLVGPEVRDERIVRLGVEPRVGGKFSFVVERQAVEVEYVGKYLELDRPHLLVCTWGTRNSPLAASRVVVEILPLDRVANSPSRRSWALERMPLQTRSPFPGA